MKITSVETTLLAIPFTTGGAPTFLDGRPWTHFDVLLVKINTDEGISGWGEAFARGRDLPLKALIDTHIAPLLIGRDPSRINEIKSWLEVGTHTYGRTGYMPYGIAAVDIALWDILGKRAGLPLYHLLGGKFADEVSVYASLMRYGTIDGVSAATRRALDQGYRHIKLHELGVRENRAPREIADDDVAIMLDVNCPWTVHEAIDTARQLAGDGFAWLEEPVWPPENWKGIAEVREKGGIRTAAGENVASANEFKLAFDLGALDFAQPDLTKTGGISEALRISSIAEAYNVHVVPHCAMFGPGLLATIHFNASRRHVPLQERLYVDLEAYLYGDRAEPKNGRVPVPEGPGLGYEPDPHVIREYAVRD